MATGPNSICLTCGVLLVEHIFSRRGAGSMECPRDVAKEDLADSLSIRGLGAEDMKRTLYGKDFDDFLVSLAEPSPPNAELLKLARDYKEKLPPSPVVTISGKLNQDDEGWLYLDDNLLDGMLGKSEWACRRIEISVRILPEEGE